MGFIRLSFLLQRLPHVTGTLVLAFASPGMAQENAAAPQNLKLPGISEYANPQAPENRPLAKTSELILEAKLKDGNPDIQRGLVWRVFSPEPGDDDKLPLVATSKGGTASFHLPEGSYLVHVAYGRAGATKRITMRTGTRRESMILDAGGLKLNAVLPDGGHIPEKLLRFSIYEGDEDNANDRSLILPNVKPNSVVRLNTGTYHVVSNYGAANAIIRADIRVEAGKLTEATVEHRAAQVTLKLVRERGGEAMADTSWSIVNTSGDPVRESVGAYASMVLAEGEYIAVAKNKDRIYQRDFKVASGQDQEVEVLANSDYDASASGDSME
ncbi:hypothetical protein GCM10011491_10690 [Brucella endophytica]|uniref:Uncharacterized protein n=1 Tax=Brucella endophytica TaxID=1963359 RepID=A0A916WCC7_9HYPH|nr:hypothetical protein GCM10011491_10690 [Brucella endophytica]